MDVYAWAAQLASSPFGAWVRTSALAYPIANVVHLLGLVLLVGPMLLLDLRLLGWIRAIPLAAMSTLTSFALVGLALLAVGGFTMFAADAAPLLGNRIMQIKLCVIALGLANAILFRTLWQRRLPVWDAAPPLVGRMQAALSICVWLAAGALGRWIAYS